MTPPERDKDKSAVSDNWIKCCDRLPEIKRNPGAQFPYLVTAVLNDQKRIVTTAVWTGKAWKLHHKAWWNVSSHRIVAWKELPKPDMTPVWENVK